MKALLRTFVIVALAQSALGVVTDIKCGERLNLKIGDQYRMAKSTDDKKGECTRIFDTANDTQLLVECSKFDIGVNSLASPAVFQGDAQIMTSKDLLHKVTGELSGSGDPVKIFHLLVTDIKELKEYDCLVKGEAADTANDVEPLLPKCGDSARSYVVNPGNEYTISSEKFLDCALQFTIASNVSAKLSCKSFNVGKGVVKSTFKDGTHHQPPKEQQKEKEKTKEKEGKDKKEEKEEKVEEEEEKVTEPEVLEFKGKQLDGKVFGYAAVSKEEQPERRWIIDVQKLKEKNVQYDCVLSGE